MSKHTYYEQFEISENASPEMIHAAYKVLAKKFHPDLCDLPKETSEAIMKEINAIYATLADPEMRKRYDQYLKELRDRKAEATNIYSSQQSQQPRSANSSPNTEPTQKKTPHKQAQSYAAAFKKPIIIGILLLLIPIITFVSIFISTKFTPSQLMEVTVSYEMTYDGYLGDNWIKENSITGIEPKTNDRFLCHVGDVVTIVTTITEDDIHENHHDVGTQTSTHIITEEDLSDGFKISQNVKVEEKPSGDQYSRWKVVYTFKPNK